MTFVAISRVDRNRPAKDGKALAQQASIADTYNEQLFNSAGIRRFFHLARFQWAEQAIRGCTGSQLKVVELGCYDGRLLERIRPCISEYVGLDANWSGGLDRAREGFGACPDVCFIETSAASSFRQFDDGHFDVAVSLETLEHIPPSELTGFLDELARVTCGDVFISVPNEIGLVFLCKYLTKRLRYGGTDRYSAREFAAAVMGFSDRVARHEHKGFNYKDLLQLIAERFEIVRINGLPNLGLPAALSFTIAIHARTR